MLKLLSQKIETVVIIIKSFSSSVILAIFIGSCAQLTLPRGPANLSTPLHLTIIGTNDIHGKIAPEVVEVGPQKKIELGGMVWLSSYINAYRQAYGNQVLWLDAGDQFQGTLDSNPFEGEPVVRAMNQSALNAAAIGNHEFDFGPEGDDKKGGDVLGALKKRMSESKYDWLAANIFLKQDLQKRPKLPNYYPSKIYQVGKIKVGVIGLATESTPATTRADFVKNLVFTPLRQHAVEEATQLRRLGAEVVVIVAHVGLKCADENAALPLRQKKLTDSKAKCGAKNEMTELVESLPQTAENKIDAVVSGHSHSVVNHYINSIPVIQSGGGGKMIHAIHLELDPVTKKVLVDQTTIEGPIPLCSEVNAKNLDCKVVNSESGSLEATPGQGDWIIPSVNGVPVTKDLAMEKLLKPVFEKTSKIKNRLIAEADRPIARDPQQESALGNLVADTLVEATGADFSIINAFGIRANIDQGPITYEEVFNTLPFDNRIGVAQVTGKQLILLLRIAVSGANGIFPTSGLEINITKGAGKKEDLNGDGEVAKWEMNRILSVKQRKSNGELVEIDDEKVYTVAMNDFLLEGGDDLIFATAQISTEKKRFTPVNSQKEYGFMRDALEKFLERKGHLNSLADPLVNPNAPRLLFR